MSAQESAENLRVYNAPEIASHYAALDYLTPCETLLFSSYIKPGAAILDIGVGGGRTTKYLAVNASRYAGLDYSAEMIRLCRQRFPQLEFMVGDAADLSAFADTSFDVVVMAFNTLDYVLPDEKRTQCLQECRRVLRPGGTLIFSSHNPRAVLICPAWNSEKLRAFVRRFVSERSAFFSAALAVLTMVKAAHSCLRAAAGSAVRMARRGSRLVFWRGEGYLFDPAHGGLTTHYWTPARAVSDVTRAGFQFVRYLGSDYPQPSRAFVSDWYYYVFQAKGLHSAGNPCA